MLHDVPPTILYHLGDPHLGHRQYNLTQREKDTQLSLKHVLTDARENDAAAILIPGDLFDSRDLRPKILADTERTLSVAGDIPVLVSPGNHDQNLSPRNLTWLKYLHNKGTITLLSADLTNEVAGFDPVDLDSSQEDGGGYVDLPGPDGPIRIFGLQYRGGYIDTAIEQTAAGIRAVNAHEGEPAVTVLMAHFGLVDVVPDLGATVNHTELVPLEDVVDYLALGHIHKQYESSGWVYNPGSLEAHTTQEGAWTDKHGYYVVDFSTPSADRSYSVEHRLSHRRPYHRVEVSVTDYPSFEAFEREFCDVITNERDAVDAVCGDEVFTANGSRRNPIIDLRLTGTLAFDRSTLDTEMLRNIATIELDALYVQLNDQTQSKAIQELIGDLGDDEVFNERGTLNHELLEARVFTAIANESQYNAHAAEVADLLQEVSAMVGKRGEPIEDVADLVKQRRRALFPDGAEMDTGKDTKPSEETRVEKPEPAADGGVEE